MPKLIAGGARPIVINVRCPTCRKHGAFHPVVTNNEGTILDVIFAELTNLGGQRAPLQFRYGIRACPNPECAEPLFVVMDNTNKLARSYPAERLDFEPVGIPAQILANFEEALSCHASTCFRAAAIMVRRTLEEICAERGAKGANLKERIAALGKVITVPKELMDAADELRLLGNDAAHLESNLYDEIGCEEAEIAIELTKEILKAVYQLSGLVDRLRKLKKPHV